MRRTVTDPAQASRPESDGSAALAARPGPSPLVSVIVTAFNQQEFISQAVDSVLAQDYRNLECIVVDDGSTDGTAAVLSRITDPRLRVVHQANQGVSGALNAGIEMCSGKIVAFLDGDDRWRPGRLTRDVEILHREPSVGVVFCNAVRFEGDRYLEDDAFTYYEELAGMTSRTVPELDAGVIDRACFESILEMAELPSFFSMVSVRREVLGTQRFLPRAAAEDPMLEDWHLFPLLLRGTHVAYCREPLVEMRRHTGNFSQDYRDLEPLKLNAFRKMLEADLTPSQRRAVRRRIARQHASVGYWRLERKEYRRAVASFLRSVVAGRPLSGAKGLALACVAQLRIR
jgi:glycosyltransferase involved in cell wall biosynthesis